MKLFILYVFPWLISILAIASLALVFTIVYLVIDAIGLDASAIKTVGIWVCGVIYFVMVLVTHFVFRFKNLWN